MKKGQQKPSGDANNNQVTSTVEDSQDASNGSHETNKNDSPTTNADVSSSSPVRCNDSDDSNQLSSKEKLAKFSFEHKPQ